MKHIPETSAPFQFGPLMIDPVAYGSAGNAILGIRDSGKTYTAGGMAEHLHDAGIPFVAFDPIGVWRFLRVPGKGRGYPVVVAGGQHGDLPLTPRSAPAIVEAAMQNGVSLVIDLFSIDLSKADWKRIVRDCVRLMLHRNQQHGLRHVFLEEAAEFAPQVVGRGDADGAVYAEIEKLARMGGNARLGYTLINQRAEEVNKAVLELCDNLFLHRQKGRNSLTALSKWLDIGAVKDHKQIIDTLSTLPTGECWAWLAGTERPVHVNVPAKNSLHPDRRVMRGDADIESRPAVDVGLFVETMRATLETVEEEAKENDPKLLKARIRELEQKRGAPTELAVDIEALAAAEQRGRIDGMRASVAWFRDGFNRPLQQIRSAVQRFEQETAIIAGAADAIGAEFEKELPDGVATLVDTPAPATFPDHIDRSGRGHYNEGRAPTRIVYGGGPGGGKTAAARQTRGPALRVHAAASKVSGPQQRILDALAWLESVGISSADRVRTAMFADQSSRSSGYEKNVSTLRTAGLIDYPSGGVLALTAAGRAQARKPERAITTAALHEAIRRHVSGPQWRILAAAIDAYPAALKREDLATRSDQSAASSGFEKNVSTLRSLGFIDYPASGQVVALPVLFLKGRK